MLYTEKDIAAFKGQKFTYLLIEEQDHLLTITLNRSEKKNAMNPALMNELVFALSYAHYTSSIWTVVLAAKGDVFCAGADLRFFAGEEESPSPSTIPEPPSEVLLGELFIQLHKPCIAKVQGPVYAGGFLLICGCSHVVAAEHAAFTLPEVKRGLWPMQVMASLLQIMPARKALDLCMRAPALSAKEALGMGLVTEVVSDADLDDAVSKLVDELQQYSPNAIRMGLKAYDELRSKKSDESHAYLMAMLREVLQSQDAHEGMQAFKEKRKPNWKG